MQLSGHYASPAPQAENSRPRTLLPEGSFCSIRGTGSVHDHEPTRPFTRYTRKSLASQTVDGFVKALKNHSSKENT